MDPQAGSLDHDVEYHAKWERMWEDGLKPGQVRTALPPPLLRR